MILGTFLDLIMFVSYGSPLLFSLDLVRTYARTFTLWVTEIVVVGCIAQLFYAWRMYKFSKKARWLCITISVVSFLTKRLILLPKNTIFIKDRFCSIRGCDLLRHLVRNSGHYSDLHNNSKVKVTAIVSSSSFCLIFNHLRFVDMVRWKRFV